MSLITESDLIKRNTIAVCRYISLLNNILNFEHECNIPVISFRIFGAHTEDWLSLTNGDRINYIFLILASEGYHIHYSPELNKLLLEPPPYDSLSKLIAQGITSADPDPSVTYTNSTNKYR